jgi:hypothetical protein
MSWKKQKHSIAKMKEVIPHKDYQIVTYMKGPNTQNTFMTSWTALVGKQYGTLVSLL